MSSSTPALGQHRLGSHLSKAEVDSIMNFTVNLEGVEFPVTLAEFRPIALVCEHPGLWKTDLDGACRWLARKYNWEKERAKGMFGGKVVTGPILHQIYKSRPKDMLKEMRFKDSERVAMASMLQTSYNGLEKAAKTHEWSTLD